MERLEAAMNKAREARQQARTQGPEGEPAAAAAPGVPAPAGAAGLPVLPAVPAASPPPMPSSRTPGDVTPDLSPPDRSSPEPSLFDPSAGDPIAVDPAPATPSSAVPSVGTPIPGTPNPAVPDSDLRRPDAPTEPAARPAAAAASPDPLLLVAAPGGPGAMVSAGREAPSAAATTVPVGDWDRLRRIEMPLPHAPKRRLGALMGPEFAAPYDLLRTRVLRQMTAQGWSRLAVTSPGKACGKTTVSLNLALSLARQPDLRVLLMDFDLRRPALARMLSYTQPDSMALLLEGGTDFAAQAVRYGANLAICLNQQGIRNSSELLQSAQTAAVLDAIEAEWRPDIVIFDMAPLQGNDDSLGFLGRVDCALLVAAAGSTSTGQIDVCEKELAAVTNVVGVVLNKCRYLGSEPGYDTYS